MHFKAGIGDIQGGLNPSNAAADNGDRSDFSCMLSWLAVFHQLFQILSVGWSKTCFLSQCYFYKMIEQSDTINPQSAIRNPQSAIQNQNYA
jgi:hypothetical protein